MLITNEGVHMGTQETAGFQRKEFHDVAADLRDRMQRFQFTAPSSLHDSKDKLRMLDPAQRNLSRAVTLMIARRVTMDEPVGDLSSRYFVTSSSKAKRMRTLGNRYPLDLSHPKTIQFEEEILRELPTLDHSLIIAAVDDPTTKIDHWPVTWLLAVKELLEIQQWPATPESWRRLYLFIQTDPVLNHRFAETVERHTEAGTTKAEVVLDELREETYLTSVNAAERRAARNGETKKNGEPRDARAEIMPPLAVNTQVKSILEKMEPDHFEYDEKTSGFGEIDPSYLEAELEEFKSSLPRLNQHVLAFHIATMGTASDQETAGSLRDAGQARLHGFEIARKRGGNSAAETTADPQVENTHELELEFARTLAGMSAGKARTIRLENVAQLRIFFEGAVSQEVRRPSSNAK